MRTKKIEEIENTTDSGLALSCPECEGDASTLYRLKGDTGGTCGYCFMARHMPDMRVIK